MVWGQCLTSNDDTADDHKEYVLSVLTKGPGTFIHT